MERFPFDDEYVRRLKERDPETSDHFSTYFGGLLLAKLRRELHSKEEIEDAGQVVLTRVLGKLSELRDGTRLGGFVFSVCENVLKESYRRAASGVVVDVVVDPPDPHDFEQELVDEESRQYVREVVNGLRPRDAAVLQAVFFDDEDKDEICRRLRITRRNLRVRLHRALKRFRTAYRRKRKPPGT